MTVIRKPVHFDTLAKNIYGLNISLIISAVKSGKGTVLQESTEQHVLVAFTAAKLLRLQPAACNSTVTERNCSVQYIKHTDIPHTRSFT